MSVKAQGAALAPAPESTMNEPVPASAGSPLVAKQTHREHRAFSNTPPNAGRLLTAR
jgi:hypothetical protein